MNPKEMREKFAARLRALQPWNRIPVDYQECRFCHSVRQSHLWKYGVRHYICDFCKRDREKAGPVVTPGDPTEPRVD